MCFNLVYLLSVLITYSWLLMSVVSLQRREDWTSLQLCLFLDWRLTHMAVLTSQRSDHETVCSTGTLNIIQLFHLWPIWLFRFFISSHRRHTTKDLNVQMEKSQVSKVYCPAKGPLLWNMFGCHKKEEKKKKIVFSNTWWIVKLTQCVCLQGGEIKVYRNKTQWTLILLLILCVSDITVFVRI